MIKTFIAIAVAGFLVSTSGAVAGTKHYSISLSAPFCVTANVNVKGSAVTANESDGCQTYVGAGFIGTVKKAGKQAIIGGISDQFSGDEVVITLDYPFITGGNYAVYATADGITMTTVGSGQYTVN